MKDAQTVNLQNQGYVQCFEILFDSMICAMFELYSQQDIRSLRLMHNRASKENAMYQCSPPSARVPPSCAVMPS